VRDVTQKEMDEAMKEMAKSMPKPGSQTARRPGA
jgi:hypothetical protein